MVALSPSSWRPATRALGALFAGSAVALSATVLHGGSLLLTGHEAEFAAEPFADPIVTHPEQQLPAASFTAPLSGPGQAAPWAPGATPQLSSPLTNLPVRQAPILEASRPSRPAAPASPTATSTAPDGSSAASPAAPAGGATAAHTSTTDTAPQDADPQHGPVGGLLDNVADATKRISR